MKKQSIVTDSRRSAQPAPGEHVAGPLERATFRMGAARREQLPPAGAREIAFAGRSNAGKSSAINALARQTRLAFASRTPGRTQQINFFELRSGAFVADLPGYGYAAVPHALKQGWQELLWSYVTTRDTLIGLVLVVDARHGLRDQDNDLLAAFLPSGRPVLVLATKIDKLNQSERRAAVSAISAKLGETFPDRVAATTVIPFSATLREGVGAANAILAAWLGGAGTRAEAMDPRGAHEH
jgi:GTP-binding protein